MAVFQLALPFWQMKKKQKSGAVGKIPMMATAKKQLKHQRKIAISSVILGVWSISRRSKEAPQISTMVARPAMGRRDQRSNAPRSKSDAATICGRRRAAPS